MVAKRVKIVSSRHGPRSAVISAHFPYTPSLLTYWYSTVHSTVLTDEGGNHVSLSDARQNGHVLKTVVVLTEDKAGLKPSISAVTPRKENFCFIKAAVGCDGDSKLEHQSYPRQLLPTMLSNSKFQFLWVIGNANSAGWGSPCLGHVTAQCLPTYLT